MLDIEDRIAELLAAEPGRALPLHRVRRALLAEGRIEPERAAAVRDVIERSNRFVILETRDPFGEHGAWPAGVRERYCEALGFTAAPCVLLLPGATDAVPAGTLDLAQRTLAELWAASRPDGELREGLALALAETEALRRALGRGGR